MAIAKNPLRNLTASGDREAAAFISGATRPSAQGTGNENRKPIMVRIPPALLTRVDRGAKRLGISRSAFIVSSTAEKLERMES